MTDEEYEQKRQTLMAEAEEAKKVLNVARRKYDSICDQLWQLRVERRERQSEAQ